jgi:hypothetical protein
MKKKAASFISTTMKSMVILILLIVGHSCIFYHSPDRVSFPSTPYNFTTLNSIYDDYNYSEYDDGFFFDFVFSTNRFSKGKDFDFIYFSIAPTRTFDVETYYESSSITVEIWKDSTLTLLDSLNSGANELGPYFTEQEFSGEDSFYDPRKDLKTERKRFFYTSDRNGNQDIFCIYYEYVPDDDDLIPIGDPLYLSAINTDADEGYFTFHPGINDSCEIIYFTSNREGTFDIYQAISEENKPIEESFTVDITRMNELSSDSNDKCPFFKNGKIVFASDRPGGFGGFDLYYSIYDGIEWSKPKNLGEDINTEYNEYRPVIIEAPRGIWKSNLMVFSSDRPEGKGGYDLYYVGISRRLI